MSEFGRAYVFHATDREVVIQHPQGKYLRVDPNTQSEVCPNGGKGKWAQWIVELQNDKTQCKLKSKATGKYLRIKQDQSIDCNGGGGKWTVFNIKKQDEPGYVKLESAQQEGVYLAVKQDNTIRIGGGGRWTLLKFFRD